MNVVDTCRIPPDSRKERRDPLVKAILDLPYGKAIKEGFPSRKAARKKQKSLLCNLWGYIHTRTNFEGDQAYLYVWRKKGDEDAQEDTQHVSRPGGRVP